MLIHSWNIFGESILEIEKQKLIYEDIETNLSKI